MPLLFDAPNQAPEGGIPWGEGEVEIPQPVGAWLLNENAGRQAWDSSGNGNRGVLTGGPLWTPNGVYFDGSDDEIRLGAAPILTNPKTIIIGGMHYGSRTQYGLSYSLIGTQAGWGAGLNVSDQPQWCAAGVADYAYTSLTVAPNVPFWLAFSLLDGTNRLCVVSTPGYIKSQTQSADSYGNAGAIAYYIGRRKDTLWLGEIYCVMAWNVSLPLSAILSFYADPFAGWRPSQQWWYAAAEGAGADYLPNISDYYRRRRAA